MVFFRNGALYAAPFDPARVQLTGPAARLLTDVATDMFGGAEAALSTTGTLVYIPSTAAQNRLVSVSRRPRAPGRRRRPSPVNPRLSPDGRRIAVTDNGDLWVHDTVRGTFSRILPEGVRGNSFPQWTPDGRQVAFRSGAGMQLTDVDGSGRARLLPKTTVGDFPTGVSHDGRLLVFQRQAADTAGDLFVMDLETNEQRPLVATKAYEGGGQMSPDGRWLAYASDESGRFEVYVRPFASGERKWQVSTQGGTQPRWRGDGRELFYRTGNKMMSVDVAARDDMTLSTPRMLFEQAYAFGQGITLANYDVSQDGQRFIMIKDTGNARIILVLNWFEELKHLAPAR